jgi:hypothetical protein
MTMDFRTRSADVRREAADILWRFRSSRAARRGGASDLATIAESAVPARPGLPVSPETAELIRVARGEGPASDGPDIRTADPVPDESPIPASAGQRDDMRAAFVSEQTSCAEPEVAVACVPDPVDPHGSGSDPGIFGDIDRPSGADTTESTPAASVSGLSDGPPATQAPEGGSHGEAPPGVTDLTDLPGVGAGLVWLLGRCGIHSLADLAAADPGRLEQDLGPVGQLLDLPSWITLARQTLDGTRGSDDDGKTAP